MTGKLALSMTIAAFVLGLAARSQNMETSRVTLSGSIKSNYEFLADETFIFLLDSNSKVLIKTETPTKNGDFKFENVPAGNYFVKVSVSGKIKFQGTSFVAQSDKTLETIIISQETKLLDEVVVTKEKQFIERKLDKMVINVENSIVSAGNTILDVLERSPGVMVNQESSINLKGKSGVIVMIDGKPTPLSGTDLIVYLKSVPATNIQTIEIITNPSAKYDAAGNAGIINIKFKKDQKQGFNGSVTLNYGQGVYAKPSGSINLNYREKKWNFFGSHSYSNPLNYGSFFINRKFFDDSHNVTSNFEQNSFTKVPSINNNSRVGVDFFANEKNGFWCAGEWKLE